MTFGYWTKRCRIRFGLRTLLLSPTLVAFLWWWVTWPSRTLRAFDGLVSAGDMDAAASMSLFEPNYRLTPKQIAHQLRGQPHTQPMKRTLSDLLLGRQRYKLDAELFCWVQKGSTHNHVMCLSVTVERGQIKYEWGRTLGEWHAENMRKYEEKTGIQLRRR